MRQVRYNSFIHPPWSHRRNIKGSRIFMGNYEIPLSKTITTFRELVGKKYIDNCNDCNEKMVCSCKLGKLSAPRVFYIHYRPDVFIQERLGDIHVVVDPKTNIIKYVGRVSVDYSI